VSNERLKTAQFNLKNKRVFLSAVAKYLFTHPGLLSAVLNDSKLNLWRETRNAACIGPENSSASEEVIAEKLVEWFDCEAIMCGDCGKKEATGECRYGRCKGFICEDCTINGLCRLCDEGR
jgi:hypothetical protein